MKMKRTTRKWLLLSGLWVIALAGIATSFAQDRGGDNRARPNAQFQRDGRGQVLDNRYNHGHYYPPRGQVVRALPPGTGRMHSAAVVSISTPGSGMRPARTGSWSHGRHLACS